jgi:hypothetical protein
VFGTLNLHIENRTEEYDALNFGASEMFLVISVMGQNLKQENKLT